MLDLDFHYEVNNSPRMSYRITYPGMTVKLEPSNTVYTVDNVSSAGIAFIGETEVKAGQVVHLSLLINNKVFISHLEALVVRADRENHFTGCLYQNLTRVQEKKLDVFILKLQKYEIAKHKALMKKEKENQKEDVFTETDNITSFVLKPKN